MLMRKHNLIRLYDSITQCNTVKPVKLATFSQNQQNPMNLHIVNTLFGHLSILYLVHFLTFGAIISCTLSMLFIFCIILYMESPQSLAWLPACLLLL
jgi:hypothetical protein